MPWALRMVLRLALVALPLFLYVGFRLGASIGMLNPAMKARAYLVIFLAVAWVCILPLALFLSSTLGLGGATFFQRNTVGWPDYLFYFPFWVGVILVLELTAPFLLADLAGLVLRLVPAIAEKARLILAYFRVVLAVLLVLYVPVRVFFDTSVVRDSVQRIPVKGLAPELANLSIVLVSDIQVDQYTGEAKVGQVRRIVESRHPDFLFSGGDLVTSGTAYLGAASRAICGMSGTVGTVAVL